MKRALKITQPVPTKKRGRPRKVATPTGRPLADRESQLLVHDEVWVTRDGRQLLVGKMTEEHAKNALRMILRKRRRRRELLGTLRRLLRDYPVVTHTARTPGLFDDDDGRFGHDEEF